MKVCIKPLATYIKKTQTHLRTCLRKIYDNRLYGTELDNESEKLRHKINDTVGTFNFDIDDEGEFVYLLKNKDYFFTDIRGVRYTYSCILNKTFPVHEYKETVICYFRPDMATSLSNMTSNEIIDEMINLKPSIMKNESVQTKFFGDITDFFVKFRDV